MKELVIGILNSVLRLDTKKSFEWTNSMLTFVSIYCIWGIIGVGLFVYGVVRYAFQPHDDELHFIRMGISAAITGSLTIVIFGKLLKRKR